ncbi:19880_t:CDS:2, partial [Gigaspora rosea]
KKNLMCLTLSKAKNFGINFHLQDNFWDIKETGPQIRDILKLEIFQKAASGLKNLGLLYIHQLLDKEGKRLLLWHQLKYLRKQSKIKPNFRAIYPNFLSPVLSKVKISEDNKRKEWVIAEETVNRRDVRQIIAKEKTKILTEYWAFEEETEGLVQSIHPCTGCDQNQLIKADQKSIKEVAVSMAWSKLEKKDKFFLTKEALKNIVFGLSIEEEKQTRINIIKGLIPQDANDNILNKIGSAKKTAQAIETLMHIAWNSFYDFI